MKPVVLRCTFWVALSAALLVSVPAAFAGCTTVKGGPRFVLEGAYARDRETGLVWQRCALGMTWQAAGACKGDIRALTLDQAMEAAKAAGPGWRVPSGAELQGLIDMGCGKPPVDTKVFPDIRPNAEGLAKYWSTSPVSDLGLFYTFDFLDGQYDGNTRGIPFAVRLVR